VFIGLVQRCIIGSAFKKAKLWKKLKDMSNLAAANNPTSGGGAVTSLI
jgi:hypothetical protein